MLMRLRRSSVRDIKSHRGAHNANSSTENLRSNVLAIRRWSVLALRLKRSSKIRNALARSKFSYTGWCLRASLQARAV